MKKKVKVFGLLMFLAVAGLHAQTPYFYYYDGKKQYFELDTRHVFVSVADENIAKEFFATEHVKYEPFRTDIPEGKRTKTSRQRLWTVFSFEEKLSDEVYLAKLAKMKDAEKGLMVAPYFKTKTKDKIGLSNFFYVMLKSLNDTILLKREAEKEHAVIVYRSNVPLWFVLSVSEKSRYNAMELANHFYESGLFRYAEPDLLIDDIIIDCVDDEYFYMQWGLKNVGQNGGKIGTDINICDAWQLSTGSNITVAVIDEGINLSHVDLAANIHTFSYDTGSKTSPQKLLEYHGTPCAGIIGALRNNGYYEGVAGVAPDCKIMSISTSLRDTTVLSREARADGMHMAWRNGADVISNSWSWDPTVPPLQVLTNAIDSAVMNGRGGRGCVVVFSTGNDAMSSVNYPGNLAHVIAVGNMTRLGSRHNTSNYGDALNVVAPGHESYSTDWRGDYWSFGGTSAACPHVSGIAALILSINPELHAHEVRDIIESTCQKVNEYHAVSNPTGYVYTNKPWIHPNGTWNEEVGYGLVNAYAAVQKVIAMPPVIIGSGTVCSSGIYRLSNFGTANWSVSSGFSISSSSGDSVTVKTTALNGQSGTLTADVNGKILTKNIQACNVFITGSGTICNKEVYSLNNGEIADWSVSSGFSLTPPTDASTTVTATELNGQTGTLSAVMNGDTLVKPVTACYALIAGPDTVCYNSAEFELLYTLPGNIHWTVDNSNFVVNPSGNPTTVTHIGSGTDNATLYAYNSSGLELARKTIVPCAPATFAGTDDISCGDSALFKLTGLPAGMNVTWSTTAGLSVHPEIGNSTTVTRITSGTLYAKNDAGVTLFSKFFPCMTHTDSFTTSPVNVSRTVTGCGNIIVQNVNVTGNAVLTIQCCSDITIQNVTVKNSSKLILDAGGEVNIISDFEVELGSELEIK